jgi:predicted transcriptional regulator of viral defense system
MQTLTELVWNSELRTRVFSQSQIDMLIDGSAQRRYNLVNRALNAGEVVRLARGVYMLNPDLSSVRPHSFVVAQALRPGSFVSFESALEWHGCIPEAVRQVRCVTPGRRQGSFDVPIYGEFRFIPLPVLPGRLLAGVSREKLTAGTALMAGPVRALLDLACLRKINCESLVSFLRGLRLEDEWLSDVSSEDVQRFREVYRFKRMNDLIEHLASEVAA